MNINTKFFCAAIVTLGMVATSITVAEIASAGGLKLRKQSAAAGHSNIGGLTTGFNSNCAAGFSKAGEHKNNHIKFTEWYVCTTPVIVCPKQVQDNGLVASVHPQAIVQQTGGNPDGGTVKFRVQYKCDYSYTSLPEG